MSTNTEETEVTLYAHVVSFDGLAEADRIEKHIQIEGRYSTGNGCRVRRTTPVRGGTSAAGDTYEHTIKPKKDKSAIVPKGEENNQVVDRTFADMFIRCAATRVLVKERHVFVGAPPKVPNLPEGVILPPINFELDVFTTPQKTRSRWVKIDAEFQELYEVLEKQGINVRDKRLKINLAGLPVKFDQVIDPSNMTDEEKAILDRVWDEEYIHPANAETLVDKEEVAEEASQPPQQEPNPDQADQQPPQEGDQSTDQPPENQDEQGNE